MKKISILILSVILMMGVSGCMKSENTNKDSARAKIISYMEEKYNDNFKYIDSTDGGLDPNKKEVVLSSNLISDDVVEVSYQNSNGIEVYKDDYIQKKYKKETFKLIEQIMQDVFNTETIISHEIKKSTNTFNEDTTFEEFLKSDCSNVYFQVVVSPEYKLGDIDALEEELKRKIISSFSNCGVHVYFASSESEYKSIYEIPTWKVDEMRKIKFVIGE